MRPPFALLLFFLAAGAAALACSEATDGFSPDAEVPDDDDAPKKKSTVKDAGARDRSAPVESENATSHVVLINEISADDDWVELVNGGNAAADLSGYLLADRDKDEDGPKLADAVKLARGTILSPKSYLLVQAGGLDAGKSCPNGGQSYCVHAEFGISNKDGETLYLLSPEGSIVGSAKYPANAAADKQTWARYPSGSPDGSFAASAATPGAANAKK